MVSQNDHSSGEDTLNSNVPLDQPPRGAPLAANTSALWSINGYTSSYEDFQTSPKTSHDMMNAAATMVATLHLQSQPLRRLPPACRWGDSLNTPWDRARDSFADSLGTSLDAWPGIDQATEEDEVNLINAAAATFALPSHVIPPASRLTQFASPVSVHMPDGCVNTFDVGDPAKFKKPPPPGCGSSAVSQGVSTSATPNARASLGLAMYRRGRERTAKQVLTSHGTANRNEIGAKRVLKMHPDHGKELRTHPQVGPN